MRLLPQAFQLLHVPVVRFIRLLLALLAELVYAGDGYLLALRA
jgi:hypothetical protein